MGENSYYVYMLKDPRDSSVKAFYVGKGTGARAYDHLTQPDDTPKGRRIREIKESGYEVLVSKLVDDLSEVQALKIEAELISALGTIDTGGMLTNKVIPSAGTRKPRRNVVIPDGVREKAQLGLGLLKDAVLEFAKANREGVTNADTASALGLRSEHHGGSKNYLSYSVLGLLMREGKLAHGGQPPRYKAQAD